MNTCWIRESERRPTFASLHDDFSNFSSVAEETYNYSPVDFMKENNLTNTRKKSKRVEAGSAGHPATPRNGRGGGGGGGGGGTSSRGASGNADKSVKRKI